MDNNPSTSCCRFYSKDYFYLARIIVKKNANGPKIADEAIAAKAELDKEKAKLAATALEESSRD